MGFFDSLMAPLGKDYCMLFYVFGIFGALLVLLSFGGLMLGLFRKDSGYVMGTYLLALTYALFIYYLNRIHYNICKAALR
jgi:hypothetical protein